MHVLRPHVTRGKLLRIYVVCISTMPLTTVQRRTIIDWSRTQCFLRMLTEACAGNSEA
jgi:hypothetical protein